MDSRPNDESRLLAVAERDLVADAIGDTFVAVWQKPRGFRGGGDIAELARTSVVVLSTHQTEDVAALCERVIVLDRDRVRYDGLVIDLTGQAARRVWLADEPDPAASTSWRTGTDRYRNVGVRVRDGAEHVEPFLEDAYLLLHGGSPEPETAGEVAS
jgi:ABC-2 type transport system ATP-binding protein